MWWSDIHNIKECLVRVEDFLESLRDIIKDKDRQRALQIDDDFVSAVRELIREVTDHNLENSEKIDALSHKLDKIAKNVQVCEKKSRKTAKSKKVIDSEA